MRIKFRNSIIYYFKDEYIKGRSPFPCAVCNPELKFCYLEKIVEEQKGDFIATGNYAQISIFNGKPYIFQGVDRDKAQSFFLWGLSKEVISKLIFLLGTYSKVKISSIAKERRFVPLSEQKDSLGICFIVGSDYRKYLKKEGVFSEPGNIVNAKGEILGKHNGITNYTI